MSNETDGGGWISLETDDGEPVSQAEPEPAQEPEPAAEPEAQADDDTPETPDAEPETDDDDPADALTSTDGRKYVPLSALKREREAAKALKAQLEQPRGLSPEEQKQIESARYIAQQLQNRPDILDALQSGRTLTREQQRTVERVEAVAQAPIAAPVAEFTPEELRDVAELQGYYTQDGQPDLKQAERYLGILDRRAAKLADQRVQPLIQREQTAASERQIEQIAQSAAEMGVSPDEVRPVLRELAKANPGMMAESAEYGLAGVIFAAGLKALQARQQAPAPVAPAAPPAPRQPKPEPLMVERSVGPARTPGITPAERTRAKQYGVDPKAFERANELLKRADGGTIVFEEDN